MTERDGVKKACYCWRKQGGRQDKDSRTPLQQLDRNSDTRSRGQWQSYLTSVSFQSRPRWNWTSFYLGEDCPLYLGASDGSRRRRPMEGSRERDILAAMKGASQGRGARAGQTGLKGSSRHQLAKGRWPPAGPGRVW